MQLRFEIKHDYRRSKTVINYINLPVYSTSGLQNEAMLAISLLLQMRFAGRLPVDSNFNPLILYLIKAVQFRDADWILLVSILQGRHWLT